MQMRIPAVALGLGLPQTLGVTLKVEEISISGTPLSQHTG